MDRKLYTKDEMDRIYISNICEMLENQNHLDPDGHDDSVDKAFEQFKQQSEFEFSHFQEQDQICKVLFLNSDNIVKRDSIKKLVDFDNNKMRYVFIIEDDNIIKHLKGLCKQHPIHKTLLIQTLPNYRLSIFKKSDFRINKIKHKFQPKFRILPKDEADIIIERYGGIDKFPKMFDYDYVAKHYNVKTEANKKAIFEIKASSETSCETISYRRVVPWYLEK